MFPSLNWWQLKLNLNTNEYIVIVFFFFLFLFNIGRTAFAEINVCFLVFEKDHFRMTVVVIWQKWYQNKYFIHQFFNVSLHFFFFFYIFSFCMLGKMQLVLFTAFNFSFDQIKVPIVQLSVLVFRHFVLTDFLTQW